MNLSDLSSLLGCYRFSCITEKELQAGIEGMLIAEHIPYKREFRLNAQDIPDFLVSTDDLENVVIEIKIDGGLAALLRQIGRYVKHPEVNAVLVVGTPHWIPRVPQELHGKRVFSHRLLRSLF